MIRSVLSVELYRALKCKRKQHWVLLCWSERSCGIWIKKWKQSCQREEYKEGGEKREGEQYPRKETYPRKRNSTAYLKPRVCALSWLITETVAKLSSYKHPPWELIRLYCLLISTDAFHLAFSMTEGHFFPQRSEANKIKWGMIRGWYFKIKQCLPQANYKYLILVMCSVSLKFLNIWLDIFTLYLLIVFYHPIFIIFKYLLNKAM